MPIYMVSCPDFNPAEEEHLCRQEVEVEIPVVGLSPDGVLDYIEQNDVKVRVCSVHGSGEDRNADGEVVVD